MANLACFRKFEFFFKCQKNVHLKAVMYICEQNVHFVANFACFRKFEVFWKKCQKMSKKCQNDLAKVGEGERKKEEAERGFIEVFLRT